MADGSRDVVPLVRYGRALMADLLYLTQRMRPDEIAQWVALTGRPFDADAAVRALAGLPADVLVGRDSLPILAGGIDTLRPGVGEAWMIGTLDGWAQYGGAITRWGRRILAAALDSNFHRVQTVALASRTAAHDWYVRGLGMNREGMLPGYFADGQSGVLFAKTRSPA
jgi:hypothetical protein